MVLLILLPLVLPQALAVRLPRCGHLLQAVHPLTAESRFKADFREEQEELDWALDQLPHHRTKRFTFFGGKFALFDE